MYEWHQYVSRHACLHWSSPRIRVLVVPGLLFCSHSQENEAGTGGGGEGGGGEGGEGGGGGEGGADGGVRVSSHRKDSRLLQCQSFQLPQCAWGGIQMNMQSSRAGLVTEPPEFGSLLFQFPYVQVDAGPRLSRSGYQRQSARTDAPPSLGPAPWGPEVAG